MRKKNHQKNVDLSPNGWFETLSSINKEMETINWMRTFVNNCPFKFVLEEEGDEHSQFE